MKNKHFVFFVFVIVIQMCSTVYADKPTAEQLTATFERHPNKIMLHDLIYVRLTLENKTDSILVTVHG